MSEERFLFLFLQKKNGERNMDAKFSPRVRDIMSLSHGEAVRLGNPYIGLEHLFLGMLKDGGSCAIELLHNLHRRQPIPLWRQHQPLRILQYP